MKNFAVRCVRVRLRIGVVTLKVSCTVLLGSLFALVGASSLGAQVATSASPSNWAESLQVGESDADLEQRLATVSANLTQTQQTLRQSMQEMDRLAKEIGILQVELARRNGGGGRQPTVSKQLPLATSGESSSETEALARMREEQDAIQAEVKQHDQTKLETLSKYPLRVTGLLLFNAFSNTGVIDNIDLPTQALPAYSGQAQGSVGATLRQTILGLDAQGPHLAGARSSASLSVDFFGDLGYSPFSFPNGSVRLRRARIGLDWANTTLDAGIEEPLISPLSPASYATVAQPALAWTGNLWTWAPQIRLEQRVPVRTGQIHFEAGLFDPLPTEQTGSHAFRSPSPGELAHQPALEGRASFHSGEGEHAFTLGMGAYSSQQNYGTTDVHSWAATADWTVPLGTHFEISGEAYRGRALGSLGGGAYKNVLTGIDPRTGLSRTNGVDAAGGWSQLKWLFLPTAEANLSFGLDDAFASNFRHLQLTPSDDPLQFYARNSAIIGNIIFHPRTYLILSPEYRRLHNAQNTGEAYDANIFTLSAGFRF